MSLLILGDDENAIDFTNNIVAPDHDVNRIAVYDEYTDVDKVLHRDIARYRIEGTITMKFWSLEDREIDNHLIRGYKTFIDTYWKYMQPAGYIPMTVYSNNDMKEYAIKAYTEFKPKDTIPFLGLKNNQTVELEIKER